MRKQINKAYHGLLVLSNRLKLVGWRKLADTIVPKHLLHQVIIRPLSVTAGDFASEANTSKETAIQQRNQDFLINVAGSLVGAFAVAGRSVATWFLLNKKTRNMEQL
jgi:hypothetical protein